MLETTNYALYKKCPIPGVERFLAFRDNPVVDFDLIADTLKHAVVGNPFDSYSTPYRIGNIIRNLLEMDPRFQPYMKNIYVNRTGPQTCELNYKTYGVLWVHIKKKKGKSHRNYFGHWYCDWSVSDLTFEGREYETRPLLLERLKEIDKAIAEADEKKRKSDEEAYALYKAVRFLFPELDHYKVIERLNRINAYSYRLRERYEEETKGEQR